MRGEHRSRLSGTGPLSSAAGGEDLGKFPASPASPSWCPRAVIRPDRAEIPPCLGAPSPPLTTPVCSPHAHRGKRPSLPERERRAPVGPRQQEHLTQGAVGQRIPWAGGVSVRAETWELGRWPQSARRGRRGGGLLPVAQPEAIHAVDCTEGASQRDTGRTLLSPRLARAPPLI